MNGCPKYIVCDQGVQFTSDDFKAWCRRRNILTRYGAAHRYGSIALIERFIKSLKDEWLRRLVIPLRLKSMRKELSVSISWFNEHRPHQALDGRTPWEAYEEPAEAELKPRSDLQPRWPETRRAVVPDDRLALSVGYFEGRRHLPIIELKRAA